MELTTQFSKLITALALLSFSVFAEAADKPAPIPEATTQSCKCGKAPDAGIATCLTPCCCLSQPMQSASQSIDPLDLSRQMNQVTQAAMAASDHAREQVLGIAMILSYFYLALVGAVTIATGFLTFYGVRKFSEVTKTQQKMDKTLARADDRLKELEDTEKHLMKTFDEALAERERRFQEQGARLDQVMGETEVLQHLLQLESRLRKYTGKPVIPAEVIQELSVRIEKALDHLQKLPQKPNKELAAPLYAMAGFIQKREGRYTDAYESMKKSLEHRPDLTDNQYNAACYASLSNKKEEALGLLRIALERSPHLKANACDDTDFAAIRKDPEFLLITGCPP